MIQDKADSEAEPKTPGTWKIMKNIVIVAMAYTLHFTGYNVSALICFHMHSTLLIYRRFRGLNGWYSSLKPET